MPLTNTERTELEEAIMLADLKLKQEQLRWEPWKVVIAAAASGGGLVVATAAAIGLILHLMGKV